MSTVERKNIDTPEEVRSFDLGRMDLVWVGGTTVARVTLEPGFRWTEHLKAKVGTESCQLPHTGYVAAGRFVVAPDGGEEIELTPGDVFSIEPGHDTWVAGDEQVVLFDFTGDDHLAKMLDWASTDAR